MSANTSLVSNWEKRMMKSGKQFARLITTRAIYDRVAIINNNVHELIFQWLKGTSKKRNLNSANCSNETFTIKQETISKTNVKNIQYYKN